MIYFGTHYSINNGILSAIEDINNIGANMLQIFISNPIKTNLSINKFINNNTELIKNKLIEFNFKIVIHLPYVINISKQLFPSPDKCWWIIMICNQLKISDEIGSIGCVIHVGKYVKLTIEDGLNNMFNSLKYIINYLKENNYKTHIILETAAGQGTELLKTEQNSLEDLANFYNRFTDNDKKYLRICVDTCHIFSAGYDIRTKKQVKEFFNDFENKIGIKYIDLIHLNDSKTDCGKCVDRHENIGYGRIGKTGLHHFIKYSLYYEIPIILETPNNFEDEIKLITDIKDNIEKWKNLI